MVGKPEALNTSFPGQPPEDSNTVCFSTGRSTFDTVLHIRTAGRASRRNELACNDDFQGLNLGSAIEFDVSEGSEYFLILDSFDEDPNGRFLFEITPGNCP